MVRSPPRPIILEYVYVGRAVVHAVLVDDGGREAEEDGAAERLGDLDARRRANPGDAALDDLLRRAAARHHNLLVDAERARAQLGPAEVPLREGVRQLARAEVEDVAADDFGHLLERRLHVRRAGGHRPLARRRAQQQEVAQVVDAVARLRRDHEARQVEGVHRVQPRARLEQLRLRPHAVDLVQHERRLRPRGRRPPPARRARAPAGRGTAASAGPAPGGRRRRRPPPAPARCRARRPTSRGAASPPSARARRARRQTRPACGSARR